MRRTVLLREYISGIDVRQSESMTCLVHGRGIREVLVCHGIVGSIRGGILSARIEARINSLDLGRVERVLPEAHVRAPQHAAGSRVGRANPLSYAADQFETTNFSVIVLLNRVCNGLTVVVGTDSRIAGERGNAGRRMENAEIEGVRLEFGERVYRFPSVHRVEI